MSEKSTFYTWNFIAFIVVSFYSIGAGFVESFVNYPLWHIIGPSQEWRDYHMALGPKIIPVLAFPALLLQLITNILVMVFRPPLMPKWTGWATLLLLLVAVVSSAAIQIPIQAELDNGYTKELVDKLISSDIVLRVWVGIVRGVVILYMMFSVMKIYK
jgi:hypothetical protein